MSQPPIGRAPYPFSDGKRLIGDVEFAVDSYDFAATVFGLVRAGFIRACSVGFLPLEWSWSNDPARPGGIDFKSQRLLECSICCLPANSNSLLGARSMGIDTRPVGRWAERALDAGTSTVSRADLMRLRDLAKEPPRSRSADLERAKEIKARVRNAMVPRDDSRAGQLARAAALRARLR